MTFHKVKDREGLNECAAEKKIVNLTFILERERKGELTVTECLLCANSCARLPMYIVSFKLFSNHRRQLWFPLNQ